MPRLETSFPAIGILGKPTNINNVETYASTWIINTASRLLKLGPKRGGHRFCSCQQGKRGRLVEVPIGIPKTGHI